MISLVLPTYNEAANLPELIREIRDALGDLPYEILIVDDDSPDQTWKVAEGIDNGRFPPAGRAGTMDDSQGEKRKLIRVIRRIGRRGLSSAVIEGFHAAHGEFLVVMDADGQHDPRLIPRMIDALKEGAAIAVGSRYIEGGSVEGWIEARHFASKIATAFARLVTEVRIEDPMSGFFALRKETFEKMAPHLRPAGFKILLEILSWLPRRATVFEVPLIFRKRRRGESKLSWKVEFQYFAQVARLFVLGRGGRQWILFTAMCLLLGVFLSVRPWNLRLLYLDPALRSRVPREIRRIADEQGWLLSDLSLRTVERDRMDFVHRNHRRGPDPEDCWTVAYGTSTLTPCAD